MICVTKFVLRSSFKIERTCGMMKMLCFENHFILSSSNLCRMQQVAVVVAVAALTAVVQLPVVLLQVALKAVVQSPIPLSKQLSQQLSQRKRGKLR